MPLLPAMLGNNHFIGRGRKYLKRYLRICYSNSASPLTVWKLENTCIYFFFSHNFCLSCYGTYRFKGNKIPVTKMIKMFPIRYTNKQNVHHKIVLCVYDVYTWYIHVLYPCSRATHKMICYQRNVPYH